MKILSLQASNVKRLVAVNITPDGALVEITGRNRQGKTSVLDAIWWLITGGSNIQSQPIRKGQTEAVIVGILGDDGSEKRLKVTRTFKLKRTELKKIEEGEDPDPTEWATTLTIENEEGFRKDKPQEWLDTLIGSLSFDPLAFLHGKPKDQVAMLRDLLKLDFTEIDAAIKEAFDERTDVNRDTASYQAQANAILIPPDAPEEAVNVDELIAQLDAAGQANADRERDVYDRRQEEQAIAMEERVLSQQQERLDELHREIERLQAKAKEDAADLELAREQHKDREAVFAGLPPIREPVDTAELRQKIADARTANEVVDLRKRKAELQQKATESKAKADALTDKINAKKAEKADMLAKSDMPVEGLDFSEDGVMLRGQPFEQASDAEQLETSIAIAGAMNPTLKVIRVRDGSLMDADAMSRLSAYAEERGLQVWVETVQSARGGAIVIEDGHVVGADEPVQPKLV